MCLDYCYGIISLQCYLPIRCIVCYQIVDCNYILVANENLTGSVERQCCISLFDYLLSVLCVVCNVNIFSVYICTIFDIECIGNLDGFFCLQITIYVQSMCLDKTSDVEVTIDCSCTIIVIVEEILFSVYICTVFYLEVDGTDRTIDECVSTRTECDILCRSD